MSVTFSNGLTNSRRTAESKQQPTFQRLLQFFAILLVVGGGLATYGSSSEISSAKIAYAGALAAVGSIGCAALLFSPVPALKARWISECALLGISSLVLMALSTLLAPDQNWLVALRQGLFYILVPLAPFLGMQLGYALRLRPVAAMTSLLGLATAMSFGVDWLTRRGVASFAAQRILLGSPVLAALGFAVSCLLVSQTRGWLRMIGLAGAVLTPAAMLITGTRTNLIFFLIPLGLLGSRRSFRLPARRLLQLGTLLGLGVAGMLWVAPRLLTNDDFLTTRLRLLINVVNGGFSEDQSFSERSRQTDVALQALRESPLFGQGFGWEPGTSLDTPLATLARLGIVGSTVLVAFLIACWIFIRGIEKREGAGVFTSAAWGLAAFAVALLPFGTPFEDRGFSMALLLLFAGVAAQVRAARARHTDLAMQTTSGPQVTDTAQAPRRSR